MNVPADSGVVTVDIDRVGDVLKVCMYVCTSVCVCVCVHSYKGMDVCVRVCVHEFPVVCFHEGLSL